MAFFGAASLITFASENRSTPLRLVMLAQQACGVGWVAYLLMLENFDTELVFWAALLAGVYWFVMGAALTSERPWMSERMKRRLPTSFLGRVFRTWLNPGPGTGYMFVVVNTTALVIMALVALAVVRSTGRGFPGWPAVKQVTYLMLVGWGYLIAYLGLGLLLMRALRRVAVVTTLAGVLIQSFLVLAGSGIPATIQLTSPRLRFVDYTYPQITSPFWTLHYLGERALPRDALVILLLVSTAAICLLLLNLPAIVRELQQVRIEPPARVIADDLQLNPPPAARPKSPWDETQ
jgi:hypothetical protein